MTQIDTQLEHFTEQTLEQDDMLATPITDEMSDDEMMLHHISQADHELYALDCCLSELF